MAYPVLPKADVVAEHFINALSEASRKDTPYRHWTISNVLPEVMCTGILTLPVAPPVLGDTDGTRDTYNGTRGFFTPQMREDFPACRLLCDALQSREVARQCEQTFDINAQGGFLRIEYIQDTDGAWLEPHRDIPDKLFSMVIYLCTGPEARNWGTDIYDDNRQWIGRSTADFNTAVTFIAGPNTWHGFDRRQIKGVRRLMEINYVKNWLDRDQLAFPDRPIGAS